MDKQSVHDDFERARATFRTLIDGAGDDELRRRSDGTRWTNRQLLFHMLLGFLIMRALLALAKLVARLPAWFGRCWAKLLNRPGGRLGISDVVADDHLTPADRAERGSYVSCIADMLTFTEYREGLEAAGFANVEITPTFQAADGMHSAIVRAVKLLDIEPVTAAAQAQEAGSCCGVSACCTAGEQSVDPNVTVAEAKSAAGCGCQG